MPLSAEGQKNNLMLKNFIFDLDGTIIYSHEDVIESLKKAYLALKIPFKLEDYKTIIGPPLKEVILKISPGLPDEVVQNLINEFKQDYDSSNYHKTVLIPGICDLLKFIKKNQFNAYIVTNKRALPAKRILAFLQIADNFIDVISPDTDDQKFVKKADMIKFLINKHKLIKDETIMIGDTDQDVYAAQENNLASIAILDGYGDETLLKKSNPTKIVKSIAEIISEI